MTPQNTTPPFDVKKYVKHMDYIFMMRTGEILDRFMEDVRCNEDEGTMDVVCEYLKTHNYDFDLYLNWKGNMESYDEQEVEDWIA